MNRSVPESPLSLSPPEMKACTISNTMPRMPTTNSARASDSAMEVFWGRSAMALIGCDCASGGGTPQGCLPNEGGEVPPRSWGAGRRPRRATPLVVVVAAGWGPGHPERSVSLGRNTQGGSDDQEGACRNGYLGSRGPRRRCRGGARPDQRRGARGRLRQRQRDLHGVRSRQGAGPGGVSQGGADPIPLGLDDGQGAGRRSGRGPVLRRRG